MWGGRFAEAPSALLRALNDSFAFDRQLFAEDIAGSVAWATELGLSGVLTREDAGALVAGLKEIAEPSDQDAEDVHSYVESALRASIGAVAGKLHTGRSRNDQVATDLRLWLKHACVEAQELTTEVLRQLATKGEAEAGTAMPGYTHLKQAEPITFGHWCLAYAEMLKRDLSRLRDAQQRADECPLGAAAMAGTPLPIDRDRLARSLGFARATANSLDAVSDRDAAAEYLFCASLLLTHLSRMAEDLIFFTSDEAGYAELPDALATGSSRMPQKKNPDVLELTRGHAARAIGELTGFLALLKGLPLAYNKDLQLDKEPLFRTRTTLRLLLPALAALLSTLILNRDAMRQAAGSPLLLATDLADSLAAQGIPFREAHERVGQAMRSGSPEGRTTPEAAIARKNVKGGTAPERVREAARAVLAELQDSANGVTRP
jgi:argininosuccinate lyase